MIKQKIGIIKHYSSSSQVFPNHLIFSSAPDKSYDFLKC